jgi:uncharacterized protein YjbI with pentapeptide repeats
MRSCGYKMQHDHEKLGDLIYECPENALPSGSLCRFHDSGYALAHPEEIMDSLHQMINQKVNDGMPLNCIGFNIPKDLHIKFSIFKNHVYFAHATFYGVVDFFCCNFIEKSIADFNSATFEKKAIFSGVNFYNKAKFSNSTFNDIADFSSATFNNEAEFSEAIFNNKANFSSVIFNGEIQFDRTIFHNEANFVLATFNSEVSFHDTNLKSANFLSSMFNNKVNFSAIFYEVYFNDAIFAENTKASFNGSVFKQAYFNHADFKGEVDFINVKFDLKGFVRNAVHSNDYLFNWNDVQEGKDKELKDFLTNVGRLDWIKNDTQIQISRTNNHNLVKISAHNKEEFCSLQLSDNQTSVVVKIARGITKRKRKYNLAAGNENGILKIYKYTIGAPVQFNYSTFRKRVRFIPAENSDKPIDLGWVSFKGVDLSNVEFHNVRWLKTGRFLFWRYKIIDELLLDIHNSNYGEVSRIYNQLRKNYESKLLFNEASNFFVGEMEAIRKSHLSGSARGKIASIPYSLYKTLALYGESYFLPLVIWTPIVIGIFVAWRFITGQCSVQSITDVTTIPHMAVHRCSVLDPFIDSFAAYFQFPRSSINPIDTIERILSIPILGTAFVAIRRKFERIK